jgi:hypothetical protein
MNMGLTSRVLTAHGFTNPFALAYELIPFSFVIDWWINVGDVLASLDNLLLVDKLEYQVSDRLVTGEFYTIKTKQNNGNVTTIRRVYTRGGVNSLIPISTFQYKPSLSVKHILDGTALLRVLRK